MRQKSKHVLYNQKTTQTEDSKQQSSEYVSLLLVNFLTKIIRKGQNYFNETFFNVLQTWIKFI